MHTCVYVDVLYQFCEEEYQIQIFVTFFIKWLNQLGKINKKS